MQSPSSGDLRAKYTELTEALVSLNTAIDEKLRALEHKEELWAVTVRKVESDANGARDKVKLNVGGCLFAAGKATFLQGETTYFHALLGSGQWQPCEDDGAYFIDRDPGLFKRIMESLRSGAPLDYSGLDAQQQQRLRTEADYFQLPGEHLDAQQQQRLRTETDYFLCPREDPSSCARNL